MPQLPPLQHLLRDAAALGLPSALDQPGHQSAFASGQPAMLSEAQLSSLRATLASSEADSMVVHSPNTLGVRLGSSSDQLAPGQPAGLQQQAQQFAGVPEFQAAVAAETANATAALAAQVHPL